MPDIELAHEMQEGMPVFNQEVLDGLAYTDLANAKEEVDRRIRCAEKSFPPGFEFIESKICSPQKAYRVMCKAMSRSTGKNAATIDLAPSNVYLVEYLFQFEGMPLHPRYFLLPFARKGGLITIAGKEFALTPVLADPGFSVGLDFIFIRMNRAPVTFQRMIAGIVKDGEELQIEVAWSKLHHRGGTSDRKNKSDVIAVGRVPTTLPQYLFARYGVNETFKMYCNCDIMITTERDLRDMDIDTNKYVLYSSLKFRPTTLKTKIDYKSIESPVVVIVPRNKVSTLTDTLMAGFFYMVDHFTEVVDPEELDTTWQWRVWLGYTLWGDQLGHNKLVENVESHLRSLDNYVDQEIRQMLLDEEGVECDNIFDLFTYILTEMNTIIATRGVDIASMYGKRLMTTPYILKDIFEQIFRFLFEITNNRKRKHKIDDYNKILGKYFTPVEIYKLRKTNIKAFVSSVSTPGDNLFFNVTSHVVPQSNTSSTTKSQNVNVNDPSSQLHASSLEAGNHAMLPKNRPLASNSISATVLLDAKRTILRKEHLREMIDAVDFVIGRD